jgi:phage baseplate assembly protein W
MSIRIDSISNIKNADELKYQDLKLDFEYSYTKNPEFKKVDEIRDLKVDFNENAIKNSLRNLFLTNRGEKLLNPYFGMNLGNYLFEQITESTAKAIGDNILQNIQLFEPRVKVNQIQVIANEEDNSYSINLLLSVPQLNLELLKLTGLLNNSGFVFLT